MHKKVLIVEDQFVEANDLQLMLRKAGYQVCGIARSVEIARQIIKDEKPALVLLDIFLKGRLTGIDLARELKEENIAFIYLSANSNEEVLSSAKTTEPYGFIVKPFREKDLLVTLQIAQYRYDHSLESRYRRQEKLIKQLDSLPKGSNREEDLLQLAKVLQQEIPFDYLAFSFEDSPQIDDKSIGFLRIAYDEYQTIGLKQLATVTRTPADTIRTLFAASAEEPVASFFNAKSFEKFVEQRSLKKLLGETFRLKSLLAFPLSFTSHRVCCLNFYSRMFEAYNTEHVSLLQHLHHTLATNLEKSYVPPKGTSRGTTNDHVVPDKAAHKAPSTAFGDIVGNCQSLLNILDQIIQVSPFDTSVLILGESGTGKERIADCIHKLSPRNGKAFIKVNCAALPASLIESELFGHEKGSFTGATDKRIGKFEQAEGGTIFLDEIGEMPVDLQVKLLRVLQEREIEPVGSKSCLKIDVRFIAATNRNLEKEVAEGRFRLDLYYRLNVFPILIPPLRERVEDIPALVRHFIGIYNAKLSKNISHVSDEALRTLMNYDWPGNVRELEHLMERSVLLAKGSSIEQIVLPTKSRPGGSNFFQVQPKTIDENERDHIISVLKKCNGKIWGSGGAAELLKVPPSTLKSKMKKLGIRKEF